MQLNILVLPLLGGFLFLSIFHRTSFFLARQSAAVFSFWLAAAGLMLLVLSTLAVLVCEQARAGPETIAIPLVAMLVAPLVALMVAGLAVLGLVAVFQPRASNRDPVPRWKFAVGVLFFLLGACIFLVAWKNAPVVLPKVWEFSLQQFWLVEFAILFAACVKWAGTIDIAPGSIIFRASLLGLIVVMLLAVVTLYPDTAKTWWLKLAEPPGKDVPAEELGISLLATALGPLLGLQPQFRIPASRCRIAAPEHAS